MRRVLNRNLGRDPELADLLQDVFIAAFEGMGRLEQPHALPGFLHQIAAHVAHGHIRRCVQRRALAGELAHHAPGWSSALDACEAELDIRSLLQHLPARERVPFALHFVAELTLSEVATKCGVSVPTVKRRLLAAKRRLRELAAAEG
jgi:RNA polymerase sigma-70 factor (ECF subfamily)